MGAKEEAKDEPLTTSGDAQAEASDDLLPGAFHLGWRVSAVLALQALLRCSASQYDRQPLKQWVPGIWLTIDLPCERCMATVIALYSCEDMLLTFLSNSAQ